MSTPPCERLVGKTPQCRVHSSLPTRKPSLILGGRRGLGGRSERHFLANTESVFLVNDKRYCALRKHSAQSGVLK